MKSIYIVRHCEAEGQAAEAPLTKKGQNQSVELAVFFEDIRVDRIISSPFLRAIQTIQPLAKKRNIEIETNIQLTERVLSSKNMPDWYEKLRVTYEDFNLKYEGGESSREATDRILTVINDIVTSNAENTVIVSHGGILSLLLHHYNKKFGFEQWETLSNPDVYMLKLGNPISYERIWQNI